tara:strand:- start:8086 stop:9504 length:1419 start_codon:yes stop_codon:yes gene_type:complete
MTSKSGVETTSQEYEDNITKWQLNELIASSDITLFQNWIKYLFYPARWESTNNLVTQRQKDFINGASLFPALKRTLDGSMGVIFRKPTQIELAPELDYIIDNADGAGKSLEQVVQDAMAENILQGHGGLLVDFASNEEQRSKAEDALNNNFATIQLYKAQHIINVYTIKVGAKSIVQQIVLQESYQDRVGQFEVEEGLQYRVLMLDENGLYRQELRRPDNEVELVKEIEPRDAQGNRLDYIPFSFFGAESNSYHVDASPLYDMTRMNAKHLEYSAMRNESIRQLAPTLFAFPGDGFDPDVFEEDNPSGLTMGGYNAYFLGMGGDAKMVQADSNDAAVEEMRHLEELMVQAGALLIQPQASNISMETTIVQRSTDTSVLGMAVRNLEDAINEQLQWVAAFMGGGDSEINLNREFFSLPLSAEDRRQWASDVMMGIVSAQEYREAMTKANILPESALDEEVDIDMQEDVDNAEQ